MAINPVLPGNGSALRLPETGIWLLDTAPLFAISQFDINTVLGTVVEFKTNSPVNDGLLYLELYDVAGAAEVLTPRTAENFLAYVNDGSYDGSFMHRLAKDFVLQGGGFSLPDGFNGQGGARPIESKGTIPNEPGNSNLYGTVAMAKVGSDPNSATSQFFFNLGDNSANLDLQNGGFTVFAEVLGDGMELVESWAQADIINANPPFNELPLYDSSLPPAVDNFLRIESASPLGPAAGLITYEVTTSNSDLIGLVAPWGDVVLGLKPLADPPAAPVDVLVRATNTIDGTRSNQTFNVDWQEPDPLTGQAVYRLVNPDIDGGRNLLTTNIEEISIIDDFGWQLEGPAYIAPGDGNQELYRFFVPSDNRHFYTALDAERDFILNELIPNNPAFADWQYNGPAYRVYSTNDAPSDALPVVRYLNRETGAHLWSSSTIEQDILNQQPELWRNEDVAFYAQPATVNDVFLP